MGAKSIDLELDTLEGAGGYAREMTEERAARQRELLAPYVAAADALITTAAVPGTPIVPPSGSGFPKRLAGFSPNSCAWHREPPLSAASRASVAGSEGPEYQRFFHVASSV